MKTFYLEMSGSDESRVAYALPLIRALLARASEIPSIHYISPSDCIGHPARLLPAYVQEQLFEGASLWFVTRGFFV